MNKELQIKNKVSKIFAVIGIILCLFCVVLLLFVVIINIHSKINHTNPYINIYTIASPSMEPKIKKHDMVIIKHQKDYRVNDIITFNSNAINTGGYTVTHRIIKIVEESDKIFYITKGDNNTSQDLGYIEKQDIVGKVILIVPKIGILQSFFKNKLGWFFLIFTPILLIVIIYLKRLAKVIKLTDDMERLKDVKDSNLYLEKEENKKIIALVDRANKINKIK